MESADYGKAMAEFWTTGGRGLMEAQEGVLRAMREGVASLMPAAAGGARAEADPAGSPSPGAGPTRASAAGSGPAGANPTGGGPADPFGADPTGTMRALGDLWSSALGMSATLAAGPPPDGADGEGTAAATLRRMMDPRAWLSAGDGVDEALQRLAEGPRLADAGEMERRFARASRAWLAMRQRSAEHQAVVLEGWMRAGRSFAARIPELGRDAEPGANPRRLLDLWVETANQALLETQRSEPFLRGQASLLKASTELRFAQREIAEHYAESYGLPTRRELDDVHRSVTEMRRELRGLQRRERAAVERADTAPVAPEASPAGARPATPPRARAPRSKRTPPTGRAPVRATAPPPKTAKTPVVAKAPEATKKPAAAKVPGGTTAPAPPRPAGKAPAQSAAPPSVPAADVPGSTAPSPAVPKRRTKGR